MTNFRIISPTFPSYDRLWYAQKISDKVGDNGQGKPFPKNILHIIIPTFPSYFQLVPKQLKVIHQSSINIYN